MALAHHDIASPGDSPSDVVDAVTTILAERPEEGWRTSALIRRLPHFPILAVMNVITDGHRSGRLERVGPATYRIATAPARVVALRNHRRMWGED